MNIFHQHTHHHIIFSILIAIIAFVTGLIFYHVFITNSNQTPPGFEGKDDLIIVNRYADKFRQNKCEENQPCVAYVQNQGESYIKAADLYAHALRNPTLQSKNRTIADVERTNNQSNYDYGSEWIAPQKMAEILIP